MELSQCLTATTYETMRSVLAWCVSELIRLVEGTCLVFAILDMVLFWKERGGRCCMFRMGLYNSQILQLLSGSQYGLYSLMLRVFNRSGKCSMLHRNRDVTGLDHVPSQRFKPPVVSHSSSHQLSFDPSHYLDSTGALLSSYFDEHERRHPHTSSTRSNQTR